MTKYLVLKKLRKAPKWKKCNMGHIMTGQVSITGSQEAINKDCSSGSKRSINSSLDLVCTVGKCLFVWNVGPFLVVILGSYFKKFSLFQLCLADDRLDLGQT